MTGRETHEVIIVGGGPAGLAAGLYCKRAGLKTVLVEKGLLGGQIAISKEVENYPGVEGITGFDLAEKLVHHVRAFGLQIMEQQAVDVVPGSELHTVHLQNGEVLRAPALILALGGTARKLDVPGEAEYLGRGVSYCATCDGFFFRNKTVVVVGGGDTAVEESLYLARLVKKVFLVHRRDELRAGRMLQERLMADRKIEPVWNTVLTAIRGNGEIVNRVSFRNVLTGEEGESSADGVFIFIGYNPSNGLVPPAVRCNDQGYVITDEKCETNVPGIYAAGDLRHKFANQIVIAVSDGCIAALAAAHYVELRRTGALT